MIFCGMLASLCLALLAINVLTIARFRLDKTCAVENRRRIPESDLLMLALIGGSPGALLARAMFRHKTRKEPFSSRLWSIVFFQTLAIGGAIGFLLAG